MSVSPPIAWQCTTPGPRPVLIRRVDADGTHVVSHKGGGHVFIRGVLERKWTMRTVSVPKSDIFPSYDAALKELRLRRAARQAERAGQ